MGVKTYMHIQAYHEWNMKHFPQLISNQVNENLYQ